MMLKLKYLPRLCRTLGLNWVLFRLIYAIKLRTKSFSRKLPVTSWEEKPLSTFLSEPSLADPKTYLKFRRESAPLFFFKPSSYLDYRSFFPKWDSRSADPVSQADQIIQGNFVYFNNISVQLGVPPNWHFNPFSGDELPLDRHWSQISDFGNGDIKVIWELNRFGFTYSLVRAYWRSGDDSYPELFWRLVDDWRINNPPQQGANWKCGQEISFRVMAWCFGFYGFLESSSSTPERVANLAQMIAVSGERIKANINYALSQRNNHGISEGLGLWTIGLLFPEYRFAEEWRKLGREILEKLSRDLIYEDGSFSQHSMYYQRLMLHDYLWAIRLGDLNNQSLPQTVKQKIALAGEFLYQVQDEVTGKAPNYGSNDGSLILPLNNCDYQDFRPVVQAINFLLHKKRCFDSGPWDEDLLWLFGPDSLNTPLEDKNRADLIAESGGYYTLRTSKGFALVRCCESFKHRPGHADMLNVDIWWRGQNIALDAGTYSYNAPEPWNNALAGTIFHNAATVNERNQMDRVNRFLWLPWVKCRVHHNTRSSGNVLRYWEGEHDGYQRFTSPVSCQRGILRIGQEHWLIIDRLSNSIQQLYQCQWLLPDLPYVWCQDKGLLTLKTPAGPYNIQLGSLEGENSCSLIKGDRNSPRGWVSNYYYSKKPALSLRIETSAKSSLIWSLFGPDFATVTIIESIMHIATGLWKVDIHLRKNQSDRQALISAVILNGSIQERLNIL